MLEPYPHSSSEPLPHPNQVLEENRLAYIGLRDIDPEEGAMLRASNVHVYTMRDVDKHGIAKARPR